MEGSANKALEKRSASARLIMLERTVLEVNVVTLTASTYILTIKQQLIDSQFYKNEEFYWVLQEYFVFHSVGLLIQVEMNLYVNGLPINWSYVDKTESGISNAACKKVM
ncbi:unnamed protein product [Rodentolepis nana]|uniref:TIP41-like protein n=1 Tax=Rodentolepis nana TaxID=102285 RepID=A0A0R3TFQ1_RODNA|nr:unnamed protein product [Rodentolepis nana]